MWIPMAISLFCLGNLKFLAPFLPQSFAKQEIKDSINPLMNFKSLS
jgi:hypothetical protein